MDAAPKKGYRLVARPEQLSAAEIRQGLAAQVVGRVVECRQSVGSTMDEATALAAAGAVEGTVVCAEQQTSGRGRLGRRWDSPAGQGIYLSVILRPDWPPTEVAKLTLLAAVAVCESVRPCGIAACIKWPNDILVDGRKLAGILTELNAEVDRVNFVVIGLGLNVNAAAGQLPPQAVSLRMAAGQSFARGPVIRQVLTRLEHWYRLVQAEGFAPMLSRWKELSVTMGQRVRISDARGAVEGLAVDLSEHGGLVILDDEGRRVTRMSGDVKIIKDLSDG